MPLSPQDLTTLALVFNDNVIKDSVLDRGGQLETYLAALQPVVAGLSRDIPQAADLLTVITSQRRILTDIALQKGAATQIATPVTYDRHRGGYLNAKEQAAEFARYKTALYRLCDSIGQRIAAECASRSVYIPGGWVAEIGHAMQYKLTLHTEGYLLEVFNTGAGAQHHASIATPEGAEDYKQKIATKKKYLISKDNIRQVLAELLKFQILDMQEYKRTVDESLRGFQYDTALYGSIAKHGREITEVEQHAIARSQYSGTCSVRSFNEVLKEILRAEDVSQKNISYLKVKYALRRALLEDYFTKMTGVRRAVDSCYVEQVSHALHNFAGFIHKQLAKFGEDVFRDTFGPVEEIRSYIEEKKKILDTIPVQYPTEDVAVRWWREYDPAISTVSPKDIPLWNAVMDVRRLDEILQVPQFSIRDYANTVKDIIGAGPYKRYHLIRLLENMHKALDTYRLPGTMEEMSLDEFCGLENLLEHYQFVAREVYGENPPTRIHAFYRDVLKRIVSNPSYYYQSTYGCLANSYLKSEPTNPCTATMQSSIDRVALNPAGTVGSTLGYKEYFQPEVERILRNTPDGIKLSMVSELGLEIDPYFRTSDESRVWFVLITLFRLSKNERTAVLDRVKRSEVKLALERLITKYDKILHIRIIADTAVDRAKNITAPKTHIAHLIKIEKIDDRLYVSPDFYHAQIADLAHHSFTPITTPDIFKATYWGSSRYTELFDYRYEISDRSHNNIERYSHELKLRSAGTKEETVAEISTRRLAYPHSNSRKAIDMLLSIFVGEDKKKLSEFDYQQYFQQTLFTPLYLAHYFSIARNKKTKLDYIVRYFSENLRFFSKTAFLSTSSYLFNLRMLTFISLYALEQDLCPDATNQVFDDLLNNYLSVKNILDDIVPGSAQLYQINALRFIVLQTKLHNPKCSTTASEQSELKKLYLELYQNELEYADSLDTSTRYQLDRSLNTYNLSLSPELKSEIEEWLKNINLDGERRTLPYNLLHSTDYIAVFGRGVNFDCNIEHEGKLISFEDKKENVCYRAIKKAAGYVIQRKINDVWYQYFATKDLADQYLELPQYMRDKKHKYWIKTQTATASRSPKVIVYTSDKIDPDYVMYDGSPGIIRSAESNILNLSVVPEPHVIERMLRESKFPEHRPMSSLIQRVLGKLCLFEDINHIQICLTRKNSVTFKLVRYGIEFEIVGSDVARSNIVCLTSPGYSLDLDARPSAVSPDLLGVNNALILSSLDRSAGLNKKRVLLPAQSYIPVNKAAKDSTSTWPVLKFDTKGVVEKIDKTIYQIEVADSEIYYSVDVDDEAKIVPGNAAEALYLAYVNLGQNNMPQAMRFLKLCRDLGGINGSNEELRWIYCIVSELPWNAPEDLAPLPQRDGYEYIAARCRAMSLILTFVLSGRSWQFQDNPRIIPEHGSAKYDRFNLYKPLAMDVTSKLVVEYQRYLQVLKKIPAGYRLNKTEELNIFASLDNPRAMSQEFRNRLTLLRKPSTIAPVHHLRFDVPAIRGEMLFETTHALMRGMASQIKLENTEDYPAIKSSIISHCESNLTNYETTLSTIQRDIVSVVYQNLSQTQKMAILAKTSEAITLEGLIKAFLDNEPTLYGFDEETSRNIYLQINYYLKLKVQLNALRDIRGQIERTAPYEEQVTIEQKNQYALNLKIFAQLLQDSSAILQDEQIDCSKHTDRTILVYQAKNNICLRTKQLDLLKALHSGDSSFVQMRMGGGKTKVLLPILVKQKADQKKLPIVVVPKSLFDTNLADLNYSTMKAFGQQGKAFIFSRRHAKNSAESFKILTFLQGTVSDGDYIITTPDSIQSLALKYYELLNASPNPQDRILYKDWEDNLHNLEEILKLIRQKSDVILDEVDTVLDIRKELQYATGEPIPYDPEYIKYAREMFAFLQKQTNILDEMSLIDIILCSDDLDRVKITNGLIEKLLGDEKSPIYGFFNKHDIQLTDSVKGQIRDFFATKDAKYPNFSDWVSIAGASLSGDEITAIKKHLAFYSMQIHHMLPSTLNRKHNQHYGRPSLQKVIKPADALIAIPYEAAKKPKDGSRFSNILEEINYTYQSALLNIIPFGIGRLFILDLYVSCLSDTALLAKTQKILKESQEEGSELIDFSKIDIENEKDIRKVLKILNQSNAFRLWCTGQYGLGSQTYSSHVLTSTAITHACAYARTGSMTGTPWNREAMHDRIKENYTPDESGDAEVLDNIRNPQKTRTTSYASSKDNKATIKAIFACATQKTRALIDIAGSFRDLSNLELASEIAGIIAQYSPEMKYILFFDTDNCLYALDIHDTTRKIKLPSTDKKIIAAKLECEPDACFTYYDQQHTTGIDIKQMADANALVMVDGHTLHRDILQGVMRMRQLPENQTLNILVTQQFENVLKQKYPIEGADVTIDHILNYAKEYESTFVAADKIKSLKAKYNNVYAEGLYRILNIPGLTAQQKHTLFNELNEAYQTYLRKIDTSITKFYETSDSVDKIILDIWAQKIDRIISDKTIAERMHDILAELRGSAAYYQSEILALHDCDGFGEHVGQSMETQVEQVVEKTLMTEVEMRKEISAEDPRPIDHLKYFDSQRIDAFERCRDYLSILPPSLQPVLGDALSGLKASRNFLDMFYDQELLRHGSKPVHKVALYRNTSTLRLKAVLITAEDALDIEKNSPSPNIEVVDLSHPFLPEKFAEATDDAEFKILMAKAYFINGNFDLAIKFAPQWVIENRVALYTLATKHLKNVRMPAMGYIVALESDASLQQLIKNINRSPVAVKFKQIIEEFTLDALDPETREKMEEIESAFSIYDICLATLQATVLLAEDITNLDVQITRLEQVKAQYEMAVASLADLEASAIKVCSTHSQARITHEVSNSASEISKVTAKVTMLRSRQEEIRVNLATIELKVNEYQQVVLEINKNLADALIPDDISTQKGIFDVLSSSWERALQTLTSNIEANKAIVMKFKPEFSTMLDATTIATIKHGIKEKQKAIDDIILQQEQQLTLFDGTYGDLVRSRADLMKCLALSLDTVNVTEYKSQLEKLYDTFVKSCDECHIILESKASLLATARKSQTDTLILDLSQKDDITRQYREKLAVIDVQIIRHQAEIARVEQILLQCGQAKETLRASLAENITNIDDIDAYSQRLEIEIALYLTQYNILHREQHNALIPAPVNAIVNQFIQLQPEFLGFITQKREQLVSAILRRNVVGPLAIQYDTLKAEYEERLNRLTTLLARLDVIENIEENLALIREELNEYAQHLTVTSRNLGAFARNPQVLQHLPEYVVEINGFIESTDNMTAIADMKQVDIREVQDARVARVADIGEIAPALAVPIADRVEVAPGDAVGVANIGELAPVDAVHVAARVEIAQAGAADRVDQADPVIQEPIARRDILGENGGAILNNVNKLEVANVPPAQSNTAARWMIAILLVMSIATAATFTTLLLLEILPVLICAVTIAVSGLLAVGFLISLMLFGDNDSKPPVVLDLPREDERPLPPAELEPPRDFIARPDRRVHFMHRPVQAVPDRFVDAEQYRVRMDGMVARPD